MPRSIESTEGSREIEGSGDSERNRTERVVRRAGAARAVRAERPKRAQRV